MKTTIKFQRVQKSKDVLFIFYFFSKRLIYNARWRK